MPMWQLRHGGRSSSQTLRVRLFSELWTENVDLKRVSWNQIFFSESCAERVMLSQYHAKQFHTLSILEAFLMAHLIESTSVRGPQKARLFPKDTYSVKSFVLRSTVIKILD
jgi:hypothetical protein